MAAVVVSIIDSVKKGQRRKHGATIMTAGVLKPLRTGPPPAWIK